MRKRFPVDRESDDSKNPKRWLLTRSSFIEFQRDAWAIKNHPSRRRLGMINDDDLSVEISRRRERERWERDPRRMGSAKFGSPRGWLMVIKRHFNIQLFQCLRHSSQSEKPLFLPSDSQLSQLFTLPERKHSNIYSIFCYVDSEIRILSRLFACSLDPHEILTLDRITSSAHLSSVLQVSGFFQPLFHQPENNCKQMETRRARFSLIKLWKIEKFYTRLEGWCKKCAFVVTGRAAARLRCSEKHNSQNLIKLKVNRKREPHKQDSNTRLESGGERIYHREGFEMKFLCKVRRENDDKY